MSKKDSLGHLSKYSSYKCLIDFYVRMSHMFFSFYVSCLINYVRLALKKKGAPSVVSEEDMVSKDKC